MLFVKMEHANIQKNYDCSGTCSNDSDNNGFCDELEVFTCTDSFASNFNDDTSHLL